MICRATKIRSRVVY